MRRVIPLHSRNDAKLTLPYLCDINLIPKDIWSQTNITVQDPRLARVLPIRVCQGDQLSWMEVMECFLEDRYNLFLSFQRFANSNQEEEETQNLRRSLTSVRRNVNNILQFPDVSGFFDYVCSKSEDILIHRSEKLKNQLSKQYLVQTKDCGTSPEPEVSFGHSFIISPCLQLLIVWPQMTWNSIQHGTSFSKSFKPSTHCC